MAVIRDARAIATTVTVTNILSGSKFEFLARDSVVEIYSIVDGTNLVGSEVVMDVSFGNVLEGDQLAIPVASAAGLGPNMNEHKLISAVAQAGDRLQIKITNNDDAEVNVRTLVKITAL